MLFPRIARLTITALLLGMVIAAPVLTDPKGAPPAQHNVHNGPNTVAGASKALGSLSSSLSQAVRTWTKVLQRVPGSEAAIRSKLEIQQESLRSTKASIKMLEKSPPGKEDPAFLHFITTTAQDAHKISKNNVVTGEQHLRRLNYYKVAKR